MSRLQYAGRPWVNFDVTNKEHRRWFAEFQRHGNWGHCPVRFVVSDDSGDVLSMIRRKLIDFYVSREFNLAKS